MKEQDQHPNHTKVVDTKNNGIWNKIYHSGFLGLLAISFTAAVLIIALGSKISDDGDRITVWTVGILTVVTVFLAIVNTVTSREMLDIMDRQESEMTKQRQAADAQNTLTERSIRLAQLAAKITEDQLQLTKLTQRPDIDLNLTFAPVGLDSRIIFLLNCPNVGVSTAYKFGIHINAGFYAVDYNGILHYGEVRPSEAEPIRAGTPNFIHPVPVQANPLQIMPMLEGRNWFIVYGIYWYYDGAGNRYEETFCRRFNHLDPENGVQCEGSLRAQIVE